jgi:hypothetical protein
VKTLTRWLENSVYDIHLPVHLFGPWAMADAASSMMPALIAALIWATLNLLWDVRDEAYRAWLVRTHGNMSQSGLNTMHIAHRSDLKNLPWIFGGFGKHGIPDPRGASVGDVAAGFIGAFAGAFIGGGMQ